MSSLYQGILSAAISDQDGLSWERCWQFLMDGFTGRGKRIFMDRGVVRWAVNSGAWNPSESQFSAFLDLLPASDRPQVLRYFKFEDRKKALVSRLLQRKLIRSRFNIDYHDVNIERTIEGKPYLANSIDGSEFPSFNFNVSHHGKFVVLASEPLCIVGVDVMNHEMVRKEEPATFFKAFQNCFTKLEWDMLWSAGPAPGPLYEQFYRLWCLKEAYIKAVGIGLGFDLLRAEFFYPTGDIWSDIAQLRIDSREKQKWRFSLHKLDGHSVCVAKGPPDDATESFRKTLKVTSIDTASLLVALEAPEKQFDLLEVSDLVPEKHELLESL
ncbi:hypothetical protein R1flu_004970 [Riccia fluitans]|uniref:holo-[acyl-carrier-protein] synthase n=1 Tax=Riccia fluitans TaxID=41844 RepID=A0ABD1YRU8_9MARC